MNPHCWVCENPILYFEKTNKNKLHSEGRYQWKHLTILFLLVVWMKSKIRCNQPINAILFTTLICVITGLFFNIHTLGGLCSVSAAMCFFFCFGAVMHRRHQPTDKFLMVSDACPLCLKWLTDSRVHVCTWSFVNYVNMMSVMSSTNQSCCYRVNLTRTLDLSSTQFLHTWLTGKVIVPSLLNWSLLCSQVQGKWDALKLISLCVFACAMYIHTVETSRSLWCLQVFINTSIIMLMLLTALFSISLYRDNWLGMVRGACMQWLMFVIVTKCGESSVFVLLQLVFGTIILVFIAIVSICSLRMCMHQIVAVN